MQEKFLQGSDSDHYDYAVECDEDPFLCQKEEEEDGEAEYFESSFEGRANLHGGGNQPLGHMALAAMAATPLDGSAMVTEHDSPEGDLL